MHILQAIGPLKQMEEAFSDLYDRYTRIFAEDKEAAGVFLNLSKEEKGHVALLDYEKNLARKNPSVFADVAIDLEEVEAILARVRTLQTAASPTLEAAVKGAIEFESSAAQYHYRNAIKQANPSIAKLLDSLGKADKEHVGKLLDFAKARGYR